MTSPMIMLFPVNPARLSVRVKEREADRTVIAVILTLKELGIWTISRLHTDQQRLLIPPRPEASFTKWRKTSPVRFRLSETGPGQGVKLSCLRKLCHYTRRGGSDGAEESWIPPLSDASDSVRCFNLFACDYTIRAHRAACLDSRSYTSLSYKVGELPSDHR